MALVRLWRLILPLGLALGSGLLLGAGIWWIPPGAAAQDGIDWPEISLNLVTAGLDLPVHITHAGDGSGRLFVVERGGRIRLIQNGALSPTPFLDISDRVRTTGSEEGLLSVAFPPDYASKNHFYVYYTELSGDHNVVARYGLTGTNLANPHSEQIILTLDHPFHQNHNGGQLAFGPNDGYLYLAPGDGGGTGDPEENAQDPDSLLGKLLRIDVETGNPISYTIPATNPFTQTGGYRGEIWALGLRNPWRFSFDRQTGDLFIGDVGQFLYEEIDFQPAASSGGENYGWPCKEGFHDYPGTCLSSNLTPPIHEYEQNVPGQNNCSVTGGFIYRGPLYARMQAVYFYGDFCSGRLWGLKWDGANWQNNLLTNTTFNISTFGEDEAGRLYLADYRAFPNGAIYQLTDPTPDLSPSTKSVTPPAGHPGQLFSYTITLINNGDPLTQPLFVTDTLPAGLAYVTNSLTATLGTVDDSGPNLLWQGQLSNTSTVQISYRVTATGQVTGVLVNTALLNAESLGILTLTASVIVDPEHYYLPVILK